MRLIHYDVGKRKDGPMALCTGEERGVVCALSWFSVTCYECLTMNLGPEAIELRAAAHPAFEPAPDREPEGPEIP